MANTPIDTAKVFISSSMTKTEDIDWPILRKAVYNELLEDEQFSPFAIENEASSLPSMQFFLSQVEQADFVVSIIGKELRQGTKRELELAFEKRKKVLIFFIGDEQTGDALDLKQDVQTRDFCYYRIADSQINLPSEILVNLKSELTRLSREVDRLNATSNDKPALLEYEGLPKSAFSLFGNAGNILYQRLDLPIPYAAEAANAPASLEELGRDALLWLFDNKPFSMAAYEDSIGKVAPSLTEMEGARELRAACGSALYGDFHDAYRRLKETINKASSPEDWQFGVVLVDLRNYAFLKNDLESYYATQDRINALRSPVIFPACEHCLLQANEAMRDIEEWKRGLSVSSRGFNSKYNRVFDSILNALFVAVIYGSFSRMHSMRKCLSRSLSTLARIYDEPSFAYQSIRLSFVGGDEKTARITCQHDWPLISNLVPARADELWDASCLCSKRNATKVQCACIDLLSPYFSGKTIPAIKSMLSETPARQTEPKQWSKAMRSISMRLDSDTLAESLTDMLTAEEPRYGGSIYTILSNIDWNLVSEPQKTSFSSAFVEHWMWYVNSGYQLEPIAQLIVEGVLQNDISETIRKTLNGIEKAAFEGQLEGWKDHSRLFKEAIDLAEHQFEVNSSQDAFSMFATNPYVSINHSIREDGCELLKTADGGRLLSLFLKAAETRTTSETLSPILESMVVCASETICAGENLPPMLLKAAKAFNPTFSSLSFYMFGGESESAWQLRLSALHAICNISAIDEVASVYLSARNDYETSSTLGRLLPDLIRSYRKVGDGELKTLAFVLSELALDNHPEVRKQVPASAFELIDTPESENGYRIIALLAKDTDPEVRFAALLACAREGIEPSFRMRVMDLLINDANYHLRRHAKKLEAES